MKERLKQLRSRLGLSQAKFAQAIQKSPGYISNLETGRGNLSEYALDQICEKFSVNKEWLKTGIGEMFVAGVLNSSEKDNVGERIKTVRKSLKMTQEEFAVSVGYSRIHVQSVERKVLTPSLEFLHKVAEKYNVSEQWLTDGIGDMNDRPVDKRLIRYLEANPKVVEDLMEKFELTSDCKEIE